MLTDSSSINFVFNELENELALINKGEILYCGNNHGLKLKDQVMKLLEWVLDIYIWVC